MGKTPKHHNLSKKQQLFVADFLIHGNAEKAAIAAGYSKKYAKSSSYKLLDNIGIKAQVQKQRDEIAEKAKLKASDVINELKRIAFSNIKDVASFSGDLVKFKDSEKLDDGVASAISEVSSTDTKFGATLKVKMYDKIRALQLLCEYFNLAGAGKEKDTKPITLRYNPEMLKEKLGVK